MKSKKADKRDLILRATRDYILKEGLENISMGQLSKVTGIAVGTIYYSFPSKEELLNQTYQYCRDQFVPRKPHTLRSPLNVEKALKDIVASYLKKGIEHPKDFLFVERYHLSSIVKEESRLDYEDIIEGLSLRELIEEGYIKNTNPLLLGGTLLGILHKSLLYVINGHLSMDANMIGMVQQMCWDSIKTNN
ncbi:TetR/AcrR family transcriptional regulator [Spirochaeta cellobiosiphila]|uniref:TetR/AcrR family transcriptional regulator n=1 Tax=Spirochaeta cellobiosiphila TaxID=504483 RepID=UPI0003FED727|nr:TetR/AcrR family transcriptional regulator [Spirochaeta cellobiosiphila]